MDIASNQSGDHAAEIIDTLQQIQADPALLAEASTNPESVLRRFKLSSIARHAVAIGIAGLLIAPTAATAKPESFW